MNILFLGEPWNPLIEKMRACGDTVICEVEPIEFPLFCNPELIVSYGYKHIIQPELISAFPNRIVNLHISYLPWNRGSDPNFWSFIDNTPKGVTIHYIDQGIDTGPIIAQRKVSFWETDTLKTSYDKLQWEIQDLFMNHYRDIKRGTCLSIPQEGTGSYHKSKDKKAFDFLTAHLGYDTPVSRLISHGHNMRSMEVPWASG